MRIPAMLLLVLSACGPDIQMKPGPVAPNPTSGVQEEKEDKQEKPKWDVANPPGPSYDVAIDTDEGTWMSLDVSPDGKEIVFDLLGDLYTMPIGGGDAKPLTSGIPWDMQPRYSPDGKYIAFTSDRGAGDNIWVVNRDGSDPKAVTKEKFRLMSNPYWTPDSQFIVARKHFTSRRSLGAGEIWLYHRTGGGGLQMIKKPNDQKELGEPALSPNGRYLYYSRDATPGDRFEYNKDSNTEIFVIFRQDRRTGEVERFIGGPGGAIRPTPSPDGKMMAYVRRVRFKSVLHIQDIESGKETALYDKLDRDMQETWAVHGVYANFAWTPDNRSIVFWSGGKIRRIDVATKEVSVVPFRVKDTRKVQEAIRYPVEVSPDEFDVKLLRWVQVSPKGDRVVFQALGYLWIRDLEGGTAKRLTTQSEHFELYPSFSRDGRQVAYTTWNDKDLGTVRVVSAAGGEGRVVTDKPGHYIQPVFSPDGETVVYRRIGGGRIRSPLWSRNQGLYRVKPGGQPAFVTKGASPHFGASGNRVYYTAGKNLKSIALDRTDERTHLESENATEYRVSPDGRWVAFVERFHAWVTPFVPTGQTVKVGPKSKAMPTTKVTKDAGEYIHWSGDSSKLHWSMGPELFTHELGAEPPAKSVNLSFRTKTDVPGGTIALTGARIITMKGDEVIENGTIVIEGNRIKAVGRDVTVPDGAKVIDVSGKTIIPGLIDVHAHGPQGSSEIVPQQNWLNYCELAFGVTTMHDPSNDTSTFFAASEMGKAGHIVAPRLFSTGTILYGAAGSFKAEVDSLEDARTHIRRMKAAGAFSVKSYNQPRRDQRQQVIQASREEKIMVVPEGGSLFQHNMTMVVDGHTGIEHSLPVAAIYKDVTQLWGGTRTGYSPTLNVGYGGLFGENYWYQKTKVWENEHLLRFVPRAVVDSRARRGIRAPDEEFNHISNAKVCKDLSDAGVKVVLGAHGQREGLGAHWELWSLGQGGMSPLEALRCATINGAWYVGLDADIGSLEVGKLADLVVLEANPLDNLRNTEKVGMVMVNGRLFDARTMNETGNRTRKRAKFYWEE